MKVYLIRHGETEGNKHGFHQGWGDVPLSEEGVAQATAIGGYIAARGKKFDRIICSDLYRTRQTAGIVFGEEQIPRFEFDSRLREINNSIFAGMTGAEVLEQHGELYMRYRHKLDYSPFGGESAQSMLERTAAFLKDIEKDEKSKSIAVVTHGGTIHAIYSHIFQMPLYMPLFKTHNCSVTKLSFNDGEWISEYMNFHLKNGEFAF